MSPRRGSAHRIVIAGGGVAALETMLALRRLAGDRASIVLLSPGRELVHRPLATGEPFDRGRAHRFDLGALAASAGAELVCSRLVGIEPDERRAQIDDGGALAYDHLVVASGARRQPALPGATTFWGIADRPEIGSLVAAARGGEIDRVAFVAHATSGWDLPLYELALLTAAQLHRAGIDGDRVVLVTHEEEPLAMLGPRASAWVRRLFEEHEIGVVTSRIPTSFAGGVLETLPDGRIAVDRAVTLPGIEGPHLVGVPADERGFIPVDSLGRVPGNPGVYAAGDSTAFPVKQGAIAAQQAYAVATTIAAAVGAPIDPEPFQPVLRGVLLGGAGAEMVPGADLGDATGVRSSHDALWWPPGRIAGRYLAPYLAEIAGECLDPVVPREAARISVEVELSAASSSGVGD